jgi:hypothetical protein
MNGKQSTSPDEDSATRRADKDPRAAQDEPALITEHAAFGLGSQPEPVIHDASRVLLAP